MANISSRGAKNHHTYKLTLTQASQSIENNKSTINYTFELIDDSNWFWEGWNNSITYSISANGSSIKTGSIPNHTTKNQTVASGSFTVEHTTDGSKSFNYSFSVDDNADQYYTSGDASASGTMTLTTIPRASTVSATDGNIESAISIIISKKVSSFTHTLTYAFGSLTGTIATKTSDTTVGFTLPTSFYGEIKNTKTGTGTIYCTTYNSSGTQIGSTQSTTFTATASESKCKPTVSLTAVDSNATTTALTGDTSKFIKYFSTASLTLTATAKNSATISSRKITCGDGKSSTSSSATFSNVESASFTGSATDSRGYSASTTLNKTLINYVKLTCNVNIYRPEPTTGEVYLKLNGNYFNGSFGSVSNTITLRYRYKESTSSTWGSWVSITATKSNNTYSYSGSLGTKFDYTKSYNFQVNAYDKLMNLTPSANVSQGIPVFDWGENDFNFNVPVNVEGDIKIAGEELFNLIYPIGSIYMSVNNTNPGTLFGGTWTQLKDRFLLGAGNTYTNGGTGGSATHTLTVDEIPSHNHSFSYNNSIYDSWNYASESGGNITMKLGIPISGNKIGIASTGGGKAHNNMPPYLVVYMWKRTA